MSHSNTMQWRFLLINAVCSWYNVAKYGLIVRSIRLKVENGFHQHFFFLGILIFIICSLTLNIQEPPLKLTIVQKNTTFWMTNMTLLNSFKNFLILYVQQFFRSFIRMLTDPRLNDNFFWLIYFLHCSVTCRNEVFVHPTNFVFL